MAFETRANAKNKQKTPMKVTGKKSFDNSRDDAGNGHMVKSPGGKTPKGKQSLGDRRVSFQVPGKNTPGKKQNGSFVGKKQLTPGNKGKITLQEFQGMKTSGKRKVQDSDDDQSSDDEEFDIDGKIMKSEPQNISKRKEDSEDDDDDEEEDDDDVDEEDDDDDEEDDDDSDEEEEEKSIRTGAQKKTKTPVKSEKTPNKKFQVDSSQKGEQEKNIKGISVDVPKNAELEQQRERDKKRLFMKNLPLDVEKKELQALSSDILEVFLPNERVPLEKRQHMFAFLRFVNESKAEENFKILQKKKLRNSDITLDFVGEKSKMQKPRKSASLLPKSIDRQKLYLSGLPVDTTIGQLASLFPRAYSISMNCAKDSRFATLRFGTAEITTEAYQANQDSEISGKNFSVDYGTKGEKYRARYKRKNQYSRRRGPAAKKAKVENSEDK